MTGAEKLALLKQLLEISGTDKDALLTAYLTVAKKEILTWRYSYADEAPDEVPEAYEMVEIKAAQMMFDMDGVEGQLGHTEGQISRQYKYASAADYIKANVPHLVGVA
jgi:hypothetical protein